MPDQSTASNNDGYDVNFVDNEGNLIRKGDGPEWETVDPDDEELEQTDPGVIEALGFDPKDMDDSGDDNIEE